ncbi:hypothetical protein TRFO_10486 [Tritrichomonas foetus]|uniref:Clan SC, family S33, methylesterase-like serine peptidase n=1 Tax=Tritrichomonas foetus TaxID=1144522 RepID=A0A1J4JD31_9EUKA|nr:hypothetical protein TRFO_10486 [Tritrichomonas foetus]|eukprot:OHS95579.1 hypothetical protein TRFO_10486 [Tritrichomonas foetus]
MLFLLLTSSFCIEWTVDSKFSNIKKGTLYVPLRYEEESPINLSIPLIYTNFNATKTPILFLGPGNGYGNNPDRFEFAQQYFPENPVIFIGYRGIESTPSPKDSEFKSLTRMETKNIDDRVLSKIVNKTQKGFLLTDFWIPNRAHDVLRFIHEEGLEYVHLLAVGEDGSRIAHHVAVSEPKKVVRIVMLGPSVNVPHNDTTIRLLAVIRRRCRKDPSCPFKQVKWLPKEIPKHAYGVFNVQQEKIGFSIAHQLRNPNTIPNALDSLQSITDGSGFGYVAVSGFSGPEMMNCVWSDYALHVCAKPTDNSIHVLPTFEKVCDYLPEIEYKTPGKIEQPMLIINGEFDLPRPKTVLDYFRNNSVIPTIVDQIVLNYTNSKFELLRSDVIRTVLNYLNDGNTTFEIDPDQPFVWKATLPMTKMIKWVVGSGISVSVLVTIFVYWKSNKDDFADKKEAKKEWMKKQKLLEEQKKALQKEKEKQQKPKKNNQKKYS